MDLAYALSRLSPEEKCAISDMNVQIDQVCPQFSTNILERIGANTGADPKLAALKEKKPTKVGLQLSKTFHKS